MRWKRLAAIALVALVFTPTTFLRDAADDPDLSDVRRTVLAAPQPADWPETLTLVGAWQFDSRNPRFGGFSALALRGKTILAWTDRGDLVRLSDPRQENFSAAFLPLPPSPAFAYLQDIESAVSDAAGETYWFGHENPVAIRRLATDGEEAVIRPAAMRDWHDNAGLEAFARLPDGRFLGLAERDNLGVLFAGDPLSSGELDVFILPLKDGWKPSDMTVLPDGRVLVLLRQVSRKWPPFASMLAIGDPASIVPGMGWRLEPLAVLADHPLVENYEGVAVAEDGPGTLTIYLISDDNMSTLQRSLLLELRWEGWRNADTKTAPQAMPEAPEIPSAKRLD